jgi:hypothetical protein
VIYEVSRTEPFRLLRVKVPKDRESPVTPLLTNRTVRTVINILEPEQPDLVYKFINALRTVKVDEPIRLYYRASRYGAWKTATIIDEGPDTPNLFVVCQAGRIIG